MGEKAVAVVAVTVATFGAGSVAGVTAITATASIAARATEVSVLQARKSRAEGLNTKKIATNVVEAIYDNGAKVIGITPITKSGSIVGRHGLNIVAGKLFDKEVSIRGTLKSSGGKVVPSVFVAYNWANVLCALLCKDVIARAKKSRYRLK